MTTYQPTTVVIIPSGNPMNAIPPRIRFDCSYLGTKPGVLKLLELIFSAIALFIYSYDATPYLIHYKELMNSENKDFFAKLAFGYIFYRLLPYTVGLGVNILMWSYLFHIVERYHTIPWYIIEYIVCICSSVYSLLCATQAAQVQSLVNEYFPGNDERFSYSEFFSVAVALIFIYNFYVVYKRKSKNIPPQ